MNKLKEAVAKLQKYFNERLPKFKSQKQANLYVIEKALDEGREYVLKCELPFPKQVTKLINNGPVLAATNTVVYLRTPVKPADQNSHFGRGSNYA